MSDQLPKGYIELPDDHPLVRSLEDRARDGAWSRTVITGDDDGVTVYWETNDDGDTGYPGKYASEEYTVEPRRDESALARALRWESGCRHGIGHAVFVKVNGRYVVRAEDVSTVPAG